MKRGTLSLLGIALLGMAIYSQRARASVAPVEEIMEPNLRRGERLNNPGNIRRSNVEWVGMASYQPDSEFVAFISPEYGYRAMARNLLTYQNKYGLNTIRAIINRWAPSSENDTNSYVDTVARELNMSPDTYINLNDIGTLARLMRAMTLVEQGRVIFSDEILLAGIQATNIA